jgi:hypothetical protein
VPQETEDPTHIRDVHNTEEYDCGINMKRIKERWKFENLQDEGQLASID